MGNIKQIFSEGDLNVDPGNIHNIYSKAKGSIDITTKHQLDPTVILTPYNAFIQNPGEEKTYNSNSVTEIPMNTYQSGGSAQDQQIQQLIMAYAQLSGQSPDQIMKQLQSLPKEQQQAALQNIAQTVQKAMEQQESQPDAESPQEDEQEMMARFGGTSEAYPQAQTYLPDTRPHETRPNFMFQEGGSTDIDSIYNMMKSKGLNYNPKKKNGGKIDQLDKYREYLQVGGQKDMFTDPDFHQEVYNNPNRASRHYDRGYGKGWFETNSDQPYRTDGAQMLMGTNNGQSGPAPYFPVNTYQYGKAGFDLLGNSPLSALTAGVFSGVAGWADQAHFRRQEKAMNNFGNSMSTVNTMPITAATSTPYGMPTGATNSMGSIFGANPTTQNTPSSTTPASSGSMLNPYTYQTGGSIWDKYEDGSELNLEDLTEEEIQQIYRDGGSIEYI